ncbi:collagen-binding domain-containing protein [Natronomonas sp. LN261]|uniref:DUF7289 family protein n=1 Tax=Natronomonas sp. LN261 TaxID=2750669 RepID=UPI0015EE3DF0|nr:collagen-binding domain-containing protein [Natronomonas sp. LN261]
MADRAVSNTVGIVLILGMTVLSVGVLLAVGGAAVDDTRADAERSQMENSMSAFSSKASLVGLGESGDQRFSLGRATEGHVTVREDAGNVKIWIENGTSDDADEGGDDDDVEPTEVANTSIGALVYENDGREIAYQGGGVWERQGDFSRMISPPEFHYRAETLTFPIIRVTGSGSASGDVRGTVGREGDSRGLYPNATRENPLENPLENGTAYVEIESEYCRGWQSFFESRTQGEVDEGCDDGDENVLRLNLTVSIDPTFGSAVTSKSVYSPGNANVSNNRNGVSAPSASSMIEDAIADCEDWGSLGSSVSSGTHCTEDPADIGDLTIDTGGGDVDVVINDVDDNGVTDADVTVNGGGNATVYLKSEAGIDIAGGDGLNVDADPEQFLVYVHSDADEIVFSGNVEYNGGLYAPNARLTGSSGKCKGGGGGTITVTGSVVVDEFCFQSKSTEFIHDEKMNDIDPDLGADTLSYLHVSENTVRVEIG